MTRPVALILALVLGQMARAQEISALVFVQEGKLLVAGATDGSIRFLDPRSGRGFSNAPGHTGGVYGLALSPDGKQLATCGADKTIKLWRVQAGQVPPLVETDSLSGHDKEVVSIAYSPDGRMLASGGYDHSVRLWEVETGKQLAKLMGHRGRITSVAFFPDGKLLASAGNGKFDLPLYQDDKIHFWDVSARKLQETITQESHQIAFAQGGRLLVAVRDYTTAIKKKARIVSGDSHSEMAVWDVVRGREMFQYKEYQQTMAVSPDGKWMATGWGTSLHRNYLNLPYDAASAAKGIQIWELASGKPVLWRKTAPEDAAVLAFSPDGTSLAAGSRSGAVNVFPITHESWLPGSRLKMTTPQELWQALKWEDAPSAYEAIGLFAREGEEAVSFLKGQLTPVEPVAAKVRKLVKELDDENFRIRDAANRELQRAGSAAEMELRRTLQTKPTLETELRVQKLLHALPVQPPTTEEVRQSRAVIVLTRIGTDSARRHLEALSRGEPDAWLTQEAQAALLNLRFKN